MCYQADDLDAYDSDCDDHSAKIALMANSQGMASDGITEKELKINSSILQPILGFEEPVRCPKSLYQWNGVEQHAWSPELRSNNDQADSQLNQEIFQQENSVLNQNAPSFTQLFELSELKAQSQAKDTVISRLSKSSSVLDSGWGLLDARGPDRCSQSPTSSVQFLGHGLMKRLPVSISSGLVPNPFSFNTMCTTFENMTGFDQDAPSPSNSHTTQGTQSPIISHDVEEDNHDIEVAHMGNDPYFGIPIPEVPSDQSSSSDVIHTIVPPDHMFRTQSKWTRITIEHLIGAIDSQFLTTRLQLHEQALFCTMTAFNISRTQELQRRINPSMMIEKYAENFMTLNVWRFGETSSPPDKRNSSLLSGSIRFSQSPEAYHKQSKLLLNHLKNVAMNLVTSVFLHGGEMSKLDEDKEGKAVDQSPLCGYDWHPLYLTAKYQLADIFTKALGRERIEFLINKLGMRSFTPDTLKQLADEVDE
ncbi:hypothetical protein Tco_0841356 [Tanacetum coccineum]|uniref:Uncharacterized protein n=1 Tax=Tanacetum coccineum TaxID=301880 RepID=A0ABQ5B1S2_9ASTR